MQYLIALIIRIIAILVEYTFICHLIESNRISFQSKKGWALGFIIFPIITGIIYYFQEYRKKEAEAQAFPEIQIEGDYSICKRCGNKIKANSIECEVCGLIVK